MSAWLARPRTAVWLLAGAAAIRLGLYAVFAPVFDFAATGIIHGSTAYDTYARNLLATATFGLQPGVPDAVLPPLYSASLAAVYALAGRGALQVVAMNVALDVVALMAIRRIVSRLFPSGAAVGTVAAACTACYPYLVFQSLTVVDTSLFIALLYVFLAMAVDVRSAQGSRAIWLRGTMCGAVLGLLTLTRPLAPPLVALVAAWLWLSIGARGTLARLAPVAFGAALVVTPWIVRNEAVLGVIVPVTTNGGSNFWQGNNANTARYLRAGYDAQWVPPPRVDATDPLGHEADRQMLALALRFLREHPGAIPDLVWTKLRVQWSLDVSPRLNPSSDGPPARTASVVADVDGAGRLQLAGVPETEPVVIYGRPLFDRVGRTVHKVYWGSLLLIGIAGTVMARRYWRDAWLLWIPALALTLVYVVTHPSTRYRVPGDPGVFAFAALAFVTAAGRARRPPAAGERAVGGSRADAGICWLGRARYSQPLDPVSARKWRALASLGRPMHVIAFSRDARPRRFRDHAAFHLLPCLPFAWARAAAMTLAGSAILLRLSARGEAAVVIAQSPLEGALAAAVKALVRLGGRRMFLVVESHGDYETSLPMYRSLWLPRTTLAVRRMLARFALARADAGRAVSGSTRLQLRRAAPALEIETVATWFDSQVFSGVVRASPPGASRDVLYAGSLLPIKGVEHLVDAFARALPAVAPARLVIAGPSPDAEYASALRRRIAALGLAGAVEIRGEQPAPELAMLMSQARVLVVPSLSEGLPRVALESMLTGTPVVASRTGGLPEIVRDGETGWLVNAGDSAALAETLVRVFRSDDVDARGVRAREVARRTFSAEAYVAAHRRLVAAAASRHRP
jgi:glycosyltransferase involved in cell wall biosynthesis